MKNACLCVFALLLGLVSCVLQPANAATVTGMVNVYRNQAREIIGCIIDTGKVNAAGKKIGVKVLLDDNGKSIAAQYENQTVSLEGSVEGNKMFKAVTWKQVKDNTYANEKYEPEPEEKEEPEERKPARKPSRSKKTSKNSDDDEDEDEDSSSDDDKDDESDSSKSSDSDNDDDDDDEDKEDSDSDKDDDDDDDKDDDSDKDDDDDDDDDDKDDDSDD